MRFNSTAVLSGIQSSKGSFETAGGTNRDFDSTTFHLDVDMGEKSTGETIGSVTRPFKLGTSAEFEKWRNFKGKMPLGGLPVDCVFEVVAGSDNSSKLILIDIKPSPTSKA